MDYVVATVKPWNVDAFYRHARKLAGRWHLVTEPERLSIEFLDSVGPRYVFFPHWSWKVPTAITDRFECVCFHMTDVPYGRGGSPLQNLIARGHRQTRLSALRMVAELDAGPVYRKVPLSLEGSARVIFERAAESVYELIEYIVREQPTPEPQVGEPTRFARRTPAQSEMPSQADVGRLYDHIRMLDADGYPAAFIDFGRWRLLFTEAQVDAGGELTARVRFASKEDA